MFDDFKNAFNRYNNSHVQLIIINAVIFVLLGILFLVAKIGQSPYLFNVVYREFTLPSQLGELVHRPWTLITYFFAHHFHYGMAPPIDHDIVGITHILFNMLGLYWFGRVFIEYLGSDKLIAIYVLGGLSGGLLYLLMYNTIPYFVQYPSVLVGASASVFAVMTAVATLLPDYTFNLLLIGPVRAKYIAAFYIVVSLLLSASDNAGGNIAHLGGALIGFVYIKQLQAGNNWGAWVTAVLDFFKNLFKPRSRVKVSYRKTESSFKKNNNTTESKSATVSQAEIDAILDKISDGGYESLSREEKDKLFHASKKK